MSFRHWAYIPDCRYVLIFGTQIIQMEYETVCEHSFPGYLRSRMNTIGRDQKHVPFFSTEDTLSNLVIRGPLTNQCNLHFFMPVKRKFCVCLRYKAVIAVHRQNNTAMPGILSRDSQCRFFFHPLAPCSYCKS